MQLGLGMGALGIVAFTLRALSAFQPSADEPFWLQRSERYVHAYLALDLPGASSIVEGGGTMPGITTSAVGGVAHILWESLQRPGVIGTSDTQWMFSYSGLSIAQIGMAAVNALLIVALFWVLRAWSGVAVATTAAILLATEPFVVAQGSRLTTDSFVMLFSAVGGFALLVAFGVLTTEPLEDRRARRFAVVAGLGLGGAVMSKLSALTLGPFVLGVVIYAGVVARRSGRSREFWRRLVLVAAAGIALLVVLWPALWTDPIGQWNVLTRSASQVGNSAPTFFVGSTTSSPGPLYYFVAVPLHMTPWMLLFTIGGAVVAVVVRSTRMRALVVLAYAAIPWLVITFSPKKYDRYSLLVWPAFAVLAGLLVDLALRRARWPEGSRSRRTFAVGGVTFVVVLSLLVAPNGIVYTNPILGGSEVAKESIVLSSTIRDVGLLVEAREGDECDTRRILTDRPRRLFFPCGVLKYRNQADTLEPGDYVVITPSQRVRAPMLVRELERLGRRVDRVEVRGIDVADLYVVTDD